MLPAAAAVAVVTLLTGIVGWFGNSEDAGIFLIAIAWLPAALVYDIVERSLGLSGFSRYWECPSCHTRNRVPRGSVIQCRNCGWSPDAEGSAEDVYA
jgi:rubredoxin